MKKSMVILFICMLFSGVMHAQAPQDTATISPEEVNAAEKIIGADFTSQEVDSLLPDLEDLSENYQELRKYRLDNSVTPALHFSPIPAGMTFEGGQDILVLSPPAVTGIPDNIEDLAYYSVRDLAALIQTRQVTSLELTQMYLERLKKFDPVLHCVITLTESLALEQAKRADAEIAAGNYRGPLHGIPYAVKDLLATKDYKTTWGAMPYKDQQIEMDATVVKNLEEAGAVLVGKLTMGALAWGDVWFGGMTRNPWNTEQGSSGSSAGPASAVAAGLVPFAIGTETWGSIVSPSTRCGVTGLRPTFGRVSRYGAMALSWSMDKIGPITRTAEDCAIVFDAIQGPDGQDQTIVDLPFRYTPEIDLANVRIGYTSELFEEDYPNKQFDLETLDVLRSLGADLIPIELPDYPVEDMAFILNTEAAAAFQQLTISNRDSLLVRQIRNAWPNVFRGAWFVPAVEYIQANRLRTLLIEDMAELMDTIDIYVVPSFGGDNLLLTNLTGHPCVVVPNGFTEQGEPTSISFIGGLYQEGVLLRVARAYQEETDFHLQHPPEFR